MARLRQGGLASAAALLLSASVSAQDYQLPPYVSCGSETQSNDIFGTFPYNATGVLNGTLAILPLKLDFVRAYIPSKYRILTSAYRSLLPQLPEDMYPAVLQVMHDHDVRMGDIRINDFQRASVEFPFLDLLGDGASSFRMAETIFVSATNPIAIGGIAAYGTDTVASSFNPECNGWARNSSGSTGFVATGPSSSQRIEATFTDSPSTPDFFGQRLSLPGIAAFFVNVTNQPIFGNGTVCDNMIRLFEDNLPADSNSPWAIRPVTGTIRATGALRADASTQQLGWDNVVAAHAPSRFIENNAIQCSSLANYTPERIWQQTGLKGPGVVVTAAVGAGAQVVLVNSLKNSNATMDAFPSVAIRGFAAMVKRQLVLPAKRILGM